VRLWDISNPRYRHLPVSRNTDIGHELRMKNRVPGKGGRLLRPGVSVSGKYAFIDAEKARYPIVKMSIWLDVSTSGYYEWVDRPPSATAQRRTRLAALVQAIFDESDGRPNKTSPGRSTR
jgi:hypothetical protein